LPPHPSLILTSTGRTLSIRQHPPTRQRHLHHQRRATTASQLAPRATAGQLLVLALSPSSSSRPHHQPPPSSASSSTRTASPASTSCSGCHGGEEQRQALRRRGGEEPAISCHAPVELLLPRLPAPTISRRAFFPGLVHRRRAPCPRRGLHLPRPHRPHPWAPPRGQWTENGRRSFGGSRGSSGGVGYLCLSDI
jgi:hypothetical protein